MTHLRPLDQKTADIIQRLLKELCSELDLHYEDQDFFALHPSIKDIRDAATLLKDNHYPVPEIVAHVLKRFNRHHH